MRKVLKFSAPWCQPCKVLSTILSRIETSVIIEEINIDENKELATQHKIRGVPTMILFENDVELRRISGVPSNPGEDPAIRIGQFLNS